MIYELIREIDELKQKLDAVILVHNYQRSEVQQIADYLGDSLDLAKIATKVKNKTIVFCGVKFMAETAKILAPEKQVLIPKFDAFCPMAEMVSVEQLKNMKKRYPQAKAVTYVNSVAEVKAESDVCCTSANAVTVVQNIEADQIIFSPDKNLGAYCQKFTNKQIIAWNGYCYVHNQILIKDVLEAKNLYPKAILIVHPECRPEVLDLADAVLSTSGMLSYVKSSDKKEFIIGTEEGLVYRLKKENPDKNFYHIKNPRICLNMKKITIKSVRDALKNQRYEINLNEIVMNKAKKALVKMLDYI